jgi:hypothetical protein
MNEVELKIHVPPAESVIRRKETSSLPELVMVLMAILTALLVYQIKGDSRTCHPVLVVTFCSQDRHLRMLLQV